MVWKQRHSDFVCCAPSPRTLPLSSHADQFSNRQDATIGGEATGAMSWAFITALKKNPQQSYVQLLNSIRDELSTKYTQKPQLSCSHPLSTFSVTSSISEPPADRTFRHGSTVCHVDDPGLFRAQTLSRWRLLINSR